MTKVKTISSKSDKKLRVKMNYQIKSIVDNENTIIAFYYNGEGMKFGLFLDYLKDEKFVKELVKVLLSPKTDYFFESSDIHSLNDEFIFVLTKTDQFTQQVDPSSFKDQYKNSKDKFITFKSLAGDNTELIIPNPKLFNSSDKFLTMYRFLSNTRLASHMEFFSVLRTTILSRNSYKLMLKTHGLAVPYFHFRLQNSFKYYVNSEGYFDDWIADLY